MMAGEGLAAALAGAVVETIESMAFAEVVESGVSHLPPLTGEGDRLVALALLSPLRGRLLMLVDGPLAKSLTENMYGVDRQEITADMEADAMAEVLNTVAGRAMSRLVPPHQQFAIGLPEPARGQAYSGHEIMLTLYFDVDGCRLELFFLGEFK